MQSWELIQSNWLTARFSHIGYSSCSTNLFLKATQSQQQAALKWPFLLKAFRVLTELPADHRNPHLPRSVLEVSLYLIISRCRNGLLIIRDKFHKTESPIFLCLKYSSDSWAVLNTVCLLWKILHEKEMMHLMFFFFWLKKWVEEDLTSSQARRRRCGWTVKEKYDTQNESRNKSKGIICRLIIGQTRWMPLRCVASKRQASLATKMINLVKPTKFA